MKKAVGKQMDKLNALLESTSLVEQKVNVLRGQFKDAEFQHRVELGEIKEALNHFQEQQYEACLHTLRNFWALAVRTNSLELQKLKSELHIEEPQNPPEPTDCPKAPKKSEKKKKKRKTKAAKRPPGPKFVRECKKCHAHVQMLRDTMTPEPHKDRCFPNPKKKCSDKCLCQHIHDASEN